MQKILYVINLIKAHLSNWYYSLRRLPIVTKYIGNYKRSHGSIEIDLTYYCQLKCLNCNRSCRLAPSKESISIEQIVKFIDESISRNVRWEQIVLLGGEPTLHPQILEIVDLILDYQKRFSSATKVILVTNGYGNKVKKILASMPKEIIIKNTEKESFIQLFSPFNLAPQDAVNYRPNSYSDGCVNLRCGLGLSMYGYYCCSVAAGIDRVFGFDIGRKKLPDENDAMRDQMGSLCKLCGIYSTFRLTDKEIISPSWEKIYKQYDPDKSGLSKYE